MINRMRTRLAMLFLASFALQAEVRLPRLLSDHMLLQRNVPVRIWGQADPGEQVMVRFRDQDLSTQADTLGRWKVFLKPLGAGGPFTLTIEGSNKITIDDVLVGEVWVASGQSNMAFPMRMLERAEERIAAANYPQIRLFHVGLATSAYPLDDLTGAWSWCNPDSVRRYSAVAYFFARHLHEKLRVPVGVILSAWGATPAQAWTSARAMNADPELQVYAGDWAKFMDLYPESQIRYEQQLKQPGAKPAQPIGPGSQRAPSVLYNAMIAPVTPYAIRGVIWYQGEGNAGRAYPYRRLFQTLIQDWRRAWGLGDFPFLFVQLASFTVAPNVEWPELREAQAMALQLRNTGMAVTVDIGDPVDVHPKNKQDVGLRLGLAARAIAYGERIVYSGPIFRELTSEGPALRVYFEHVGGGLLARGGNLRGFSVAGKDGKFMSAKARIDGDTIVVSHSDIKEPIAVRYAWDGFPDCNLFNAEGLPAAPFRTDIP
jgi:sialate O-acetylesterase